MKPENTPEPRLDLARKDKVDCSEWITVSLGQCETQYEQIAVNVELQATAHTP